MADVPASVAQILDAFKRMYGPRIERQPNLMAFLYKEFDKSKQVVGGQGWFFPLQMTGGQSIGAYKATEDVSDAQAETIVQSNVQWKNNYALIQITGDAIEASKQNMMAFIQGRELEVKSKTLWLISDMNRQCYGDSHGEMGDVASDAANTITFGAEVNINWFRIGRKIDIFNAALTTKRNGTVGTPKEGRSITAVNISTRTITYSGTDLAGSIVATDRVFAEDSRLGLAATDEGKEILGLRHVIDDGTDSNAIYQGVSGTTFPDWRGNRLHNSGTLRPLALDLMQQAIDTTEIASGKKVNMLICGFGQRRNYLNLLWFDVRYEPQKLKGGFQVLDYSGIEVYVDKDAPTQTLIGLNRETLKRFELTGIGFAGSGSGAPEAERVSHRDTYEILIRQYANLGCFQRNANFRLIDLQEP